MRHLTQAFREEEKKSKGWEEVFSFRVEVSVTRQNFRLGSLGEVCA